MPNTYLATRTTEQLKTELKELSWELDNIQSTPINKLTYETAAYLAATYESYDLIDKELDRRALEDVEKTLPQPTSMRRVS